MYYNTIIPSLFRARAFPPASCRELSRSALSGEGIIKEYILYQSYTKYTNLILVGGNGNAGLIVEAII